MKLRAYRKEDSALIAGWVRTEEELYKWSADRINRFPLSENDLDDNYRPRLGSGRLIPLTAVDEEDQPVGHFFIRYPKDDDDNRVRFGFVILDPAQRGKGRGAEMIRLGIEYVRKNLSARRIDLGVFENNPGAKRCYESAGFREYSRRDCELPPGKWVCIDMELFLQEQGDKETE